MLGLLKRHDLYTRVSRALMCQMIMLRMALGSPSLSLGLPFCPCSCRAQRLLVKGLLPTRTWPWGGPLRPAEETRCPGAFPRGGLPGSLSNRR